MVGIIIEIVITYLLDAIIYALIGAACVVFFEMLKCIKKERKEKENKSITSINSF
jgi:uncharacterized membrane protein YuzA (DUF378 family)